jgi:hypothetical protein
VLDLRRLYLLRELYARGTIAAVAEAVSYSPSAVSQQLSQLERESEESLPLVVKGAFDLAIGEEYEHAPRPREIHSSQPAGSRSGRAGTCA